jgi:hypothetical protein
MFVRIVLLLARLVKVSLSVFLAKQISSCIQMEHAYALLPLCYKTTVAKFLAIQAFSMFKEPQHVSLAFKDAHNV